MTTSKLDGVIAKLHDGRTLESAAVDELERLLDLLQANGWSGSIPADEALLAVLNERQ